MVSATQCTVGCMDPMDPMETPWTPWRQVEKVVDKLPLDDARKTDQTTHSDRLFMNVAVIEIFHPV